MMLLKVRVTTEVTVWVTTEFYDHMLQSQSNSVIPTNSLFGIVTCGFGVWNEMPDTTIAERHVNLFKKVSIFLEDEEEGNCFSHVLNIWVEYNKVENDLCFSLSIM